MSDFIALRTMLQKQMNKLAKAGPLFLLNIEKNVVWDTYINSFAEGTNPIYRERTEHDCVCCKQFIRNLGRVVGVVNGKFESIWNFEIGGDYEPVVKAMLELSKGADIASAYAHNEREVGRDHSFEMLGEGKTKRWDHFHQVLPDSVVMFTGLAEFKGSSQTHKSVLKRSLEEISVEAIDIVQELIAQNAIYRGAEHSSLVNTIKKLKRESESAPDKEAYYWVKSLEMKSMSSLRNTVIGTLLVDISEGTEIEVAVKKFEDKVAPQNYKRTTALVTPKMKENAKKTAQELGIEPSLLRRFATKEDMNVNDVLFVDSTVVPFMEGSVFDAVPTKKSNLSNKTFNGVQEISIGDFIKDVLPTAQGLEVFFDNSSANNLMSLIAPVHETSKCIMKWGNNFSWTYNGDITDSAITQQVKAAGGITDAPLRFSLGWGNRDDLDFHLKSKRNGQVYFMQKSGITGFTLDVDMRGELPTQVENIYCKDLKRLPNDDYELYVKHYGSGWHSTKPGETRTEGFEIEVKNGSDLYNLSFPNKTIVSKEYPVLTFSVSAGVVKMDTSKFSSTSRDVWGIETGKFHKVEMMTTSPNYWGGKEQGNKHYFFVLEDCKNPDDATGFYNEFLMDELREHRKVFELLSANLKAKHSTEQLSGLGFSSTVRKEVLVKVKGSFERVLKVKF